MNLIPENFTPGVSIKLGVTQGNHRPYARVGGRLGMFSAGKNLDLTEGSGLLMAGAVALFALGKMEKQKVEKKKAEKRKKGMEWLQAMSTPVSAESVEGAKNFAKF